MSDLGTGFAAHTRGSCFEQAASRERPWRPRQTRPSPPCVRGHLLVRSFRSGCGVCATLPQVGEVYNERYKVLQKLGWGHFSTVWRCADMADAGRIVALKVQKSASHYTEAAADEIAILDFVGDQADGMGQDIPVVRLLDTFTHSGPHGRRELRVIRTA